MTLIEQLRMRAAPGCLASTQRIDVSDIFDGDDLVLLDLEHDPPLLIHEDRARSALDGGGVKLVTATEVDLLTILDWLLKCPAHPPGLTPGEIGDRLTESEQEAIEQHARSIARRLFLATSEVPWAALEAGLQGLQAAGLLSPDRVREILYPQLIGIE